MAKFPLTRAGPSNTEWSDAAKLSCFLGEMWAHDTIKHCFFSTACVRMVQTLMAWRMDIKLIPISCLLHPKKEQRSSHVSLSHNVAGAAWSYLGVANHQWRKVIYMFMSRLMQLHCSQHSTAQSLFGERWSCLRSTCSTDTTSTRQCFAADSAVVLFYSVLFYVEITATGHISGTYLPWHLNAFSECALGCIRVPIRNGRYKWQ